MTGLLLAISSAPMAWNEQIVNMDYNKGMNV